MRLKRLVARGFKSFADRTEFEFDSRLTGIIGPNGCGKSNVVDAIKWVLGDQRAKSLRGSEMTDVIFKGAEGREAMGMAEVEIAFECPEGGQDDRSEIHIARRLTLDKESTYLLNGEPVRLKDVRDTLLDTGLGTGGYSVMEQGRIDAVLSANPEARRAIFEEAAGISRFKLQKKESLRKLDRTDQNLARVTDLLEERSRRIRSLRIQAGKARRYQELAGALRDLRAATAVLDGTALREQWSSQRDRLEELEERLSATEDARAVAEEALQEADAAIHAAAEELDAVRRRLGASRGQLTQHTERATAKRQRIADLAAEQQRNQQRRQSLGEQRNERAAARQSAQEDLAAREEQLVELHRQLEAQRAKVAEVQRELRGLQEERETVREHMLELLHQRTRARNQAADQSARLAAARARQARLEERVATLQGEDRTLVAECALQQRALADVHTRERILGERESRALDDLRVADGDAAALAEEESGLRTKLSQIEGRRQALASMEAQLEGFDQAPRHVLQHGYEGLRGRLLDLLDIDLEHSTALEAALGQYVQALVVDTRAHAEAIVADLRERKIGRVLLLVEEEFGREPEAAQPRLLPLPEGSVFLLDLIRTNDESGAARKLLAWLLRGVVLVPGLEHAEAGRVDLCYVTPEGSVLCGPRVEGGEAAEGHAGLVVRRSQIQDLASQAEWVQGELQELLDGKTRAVSRVDRLKLEVRQLGVALQVVRREAQAIEAQLARAGARAQDVQREIAELGSEAEDLCAVVHGALAVLGHALFNQFLLSRREGAAKGREEECSAQLETVGSRHEVESQREQELRLEQAQAVEAREGHVRTIRIHEEAVRDFDRSEHELVEAFERSERDQQVAQQELEQLTAQRESVQAEVEELERQQSQREASVDQARSLHRQQQEQLREWDERRRALADDLQNLRMQIVDTEHRFTRLEERLREDSQVELRRLMGDVRGLGIEIDDDSFVGPVAQVGSVVELFGPPLPPEFVQSWYGMRRLWLEEDFDPAEARKEVKVLQSQKDRLGAVNLDAVKELADEEGNFGTLEQEVEDLKEARRALMETLRRLETESRVLFEQTFAEARKNFQNIFRKLFQGGKSDMFLGESEDLLEAGIEIVAQPPGKHLQSINLLSGGERSLTAVAILFALFKVRPSPFCILDEVDAALDETNVERFLRVLRDFTDNTQFCIVTHHKRTMADCQALYGITMQRRGVSSRIAVALHEVDAIQDGTVPATVGAGNAAPDPARKRRIAGEEEVGF